ncbi:15705_t:CDS:2 [Funneliformis geosporum]|uniref:19102_t:CDS:1 n=1 Tax=Funneliformis geosporum TaxID=1117311 RepID=A0A9W4SJ42_9GLOM|nr:19102_t:CDS:2 [Funneliformis geosporum]CAI2174640.1 15705_t:CDS:2 [Funneliformis geosporum]
MPEQSGTGGGTRIIRTPTIWERVKNWPMDRIIQLEEEINMKDWDEWSQASSWFVAIGLNCISIVLRIGRWFDGQEYDPIVHPVYSSLAIWLFSAEWFLFSLSMANAIYIYWSTKNYHLFEHHLNDRPKSNNIQMQEVGEPVPVWAERFPGNFLYPLLQAIFEHPGFEPNSQCVWVITMWNPSSFCLDLFCYYSPAQVLILHYLNGENYFYLLSAAIIIGVQLKILVKLFQSLIKDKQIIFNEM